MPFLSLVRRDNRQKDGGAISIKPSATDTHSFQFRKPLPPGHQKSSRSPSMASNCDIVKPTFPIPSIPGVLLPPSHPRNDQPFSITSDFSMVKPLFPVPSIPGVPIYDPFAPLVTSCVPATGKHPRRKFNDLAFMITKKSIFNLCAVLVVCFATYSSYLIFSTFWNDVDRERAKYSLDLEFEATLCAKDYKDNRCDTFEIPGMLEQCLTWSRCMGADPSHIIHSRVIAQLAAELLEGFVSHLSYKTLTVLFSVVFLFRWFKI